ncbi:MAG TPA: type V CRISPR-associated protein Cas12b, partial [Opitutus sp.]|nr:type V CRISPR-associated protein Cas12b [Opitutus sp.]
ANRVVPLRERDWRWIRREGDSSNHELIQMESNSALQKKKLAGQRGLSLERLEQLEELRRRCLSLNRALQQTPGTRGALGRPTRGLEVPDPCPLLLEKIERLRDQRVDQTAHLILARALGLKLRAPQKGVVERQQRNIHGEYERFRDPVDFIVLEDLSRYLSSQGRSRAENSRLMQWCHRQILQKLRQLAESYGLKVLQTGAAYSSRFCSRSGGAGFRAVELTPRHRDYFPWRRMRDKLAAHECGEKPLDAADLKESLGLKSLFDQLDDLNRELLQTPGDRPKWRTLLAPIAGGPIFVPMAGTPVQADINAAINLGLRAVANPTMADIHLRIRTKREGGQLVIRTDSKREKTRWREGVPSITVNEAAAKAGDADRSPNVFADIAGVANYDRATLDGIEVPFALGRGLWGSVKEKAWDRCQKLNTARIAKWRNEQPVAGHPEI